MSEQRLLFSEDPDDGRLSIQERFELFDRRHPEVYQLFLRFARELRAAGRRHYSSDALLHRVRWHYAVNPDHDGGFKINNNFSSRYARKLMEQHPEFAGFFETRRLQAD